MSVNVETIFSIAAEDIEILSTKPPTAASRNLARLLGAKFAAYVAESETHMYTAANQTREAVSGMTTPNGNQSKFVKPANNLEYLGTGVQPDALVPWETRLEFAESATYAAHYMLSRSRLEASVGQEMLLVLDSAVNSEGEAK